MVAGKACPACEKDIGYWAVVKTPWPNVGMRCPHCKARLEYKPVGYLMLVVATVLFTVLLSVIGWYINPFTRYGGAVGPVVWVGLMLVLWAPLEALLIFWLRNRSVLFAKDAS